MAERAHPDLPAFSSGWKFRLRRGVIPWVSYSRDPYRTEFYWRYRWVRRHCRGKDVLDIPCGMGWGTSLINGTRSLVGVDVSAEAIAEAKSRYGIGRNFQLGSMERLEFSNDCFDVVSCLEGIEHVPQAIGESFMAEAARILRPNGLLLLSSPHPVEGAHSGNPHHVYEYPPEEMRALISRHFHLESERQRLVDNLVVTYFAARLKDPS